MYVLNVCIVVDDLLIEKGAQVVGLAGQRTGESKHG